MTDKDTGFEAKYQEYTICDRCGRDIMANEANEGRGEWDGGTLCNDCYAEVSDAN